MMSDTLALTARIRRRASDGLASHVTVVKLVAHRHSRGGRLLT